MEYAEISEVQDVSTDEQGFILLNGERLAPLSAVALAHDLVTAVRDSQDRNQVRRAGYYDSAAIERRATSPLGQALNALERIF
jgi:hypothetical protein